jgi:T5SS/PEP-CTERM-associated repeat protein
MTTLQRNFLRYLFAVAMAIGVVVMQSSVATAVTKNWEVNNGLWTGLGGFGTNWNPDGVPVGGDTAVISFSDLTSRTVTYDYTGPAVTLTQLTLDQTGSVFQQSTLAMSANALASVYELVGVYGRGTLNQSGGTNTIAGGYLDLGYFSGSSGAYNLSGSGLLTSNGAEYIGDAGSGTFTQTGGTNGIYGGNYLYLGFGGTGVGTYTISGGLLTAESAVVGQSGTGTLTIQDQAYVSINNNLSINNASRVNLNGGKLRFNTVGGSGGLSRLTPFYTAGTIQLAGGRYFATDSTIFSLFPSGHIPAGKGLTVEGFTVLRMASIVDGTLISMGDLEVGSSLGHGTLTIRDQGLVDVRGTFFIGDPADNGPNVGVLNLMGGTLRLNTSFIFGGTINFTSGTLQLTGNQIIGEALGDGYLIGRFFGDSPTIPTGKGLNIEGNATLHSTTTLDGGTLTVGQLINAYNLRLLRGTLNIKNQSVTVGASGILGDTLDLNDDMTVNVTLGITNQGLVTGDGQIGGAFTNAATGELRGEPGKSLKLTGANNTNAGQISLYGGMLDFTQNLTNNAGGFISGNGTLKTTTGLTNNGTMNFSGLANVVGDVTNAAGAKIISSGGGPTTFLDDVTNNGEIRTSAGSFTVFFGAASGSGTYTGTGTVNFEGDLKPGNSPAAISFAGDVVFGPDSKLVIELGGTTPGTQYDQINVAGKLTMGGTLEISLINGFVPGAGQSFDFLNTGSVAGTFSSIQLPSVPGVSWNITELASGIVSNGLAGDFNANGTVDIRDYVVWRKTLGMQSDYNAWRSHFGQTSGSGSGAESSNAVPEPDLWQFVVAAAVSLLVLCLRSRQRDNVRRT